MNSGYTQCRCRDCFETTVINDVTNPELCDVCTEHGCAGGECQAPDDEGWWDQEQIDYAARVDEMDLEQARRAAKHWHYMARWVEWDTVSDLMSDKERCEALWNLHRQSSALCNASPESERKRLTLPAVRLKKLYRRFWNGRTPDSIAWNEDGSRKEACT